MCLSDAQVVPCHQHDGTKRTLPSAAARRPPDLLLDRPPGTSRVAAPRVRRLHARRAAPAAPQVELLSQHQGQASPQGKRSIYNTSVSLSLLL